MFSKFSGMVAAYFAQFRLAYDYNYNKQPSKEIM